MSKQLTSIVMGQIKILLSQKGLSMKLVNGANNGVVQECGHEVLKNGKTLVLKRLIQQNAKNTFNCIIVEIDGEKYVGDHKQFLEIEDLLAPIKAQSNIVARKTSMEK